ncbi:hypothetical protein OS493_027730 [Desmophyllum pertusum]|uniref:Fork-head domain-containing protein n=1 Tax=Desmophyllum pertusum TaxID=174260 RepID=A0A9X0CVK7_9CNID|nr:hypothetical protein OS493_027730 [Desmophyllum pertusum]
MRHNVIRKEVDPFSPRRVDSSQFVNNGSTSCASLRLHEATASSSLLNHFIMFSVHPSRQEGSGLDTSAFRFPLSEQQKEFSQLPRSQLETQTKVLNRAMGKEVKLDSLKERNTDSEKTRRGSTDEDDEEAESKESRNLTETFVAVIAQGILSVPSKRMTLSSIYNFIARTFPHFDKEKGPGWRNSVRHNLSSNDCFVKASRAENGKGHYWMIHPKDLPEFAKGNYRRPRKPRRPRCSHPLDAPRIEACLGCLYQQAYFPIITSRLPV